MKLIYLEWEDACSHTGSARSGSWLDEEEAKEWGKNAKWHVQQSGFLIEENEHYITLAGMREPGSDEHYAMYGHLQKIPKTWIKKRVDLTKYIEKR